MSLSNVLHSALSGRSQAMDALGRLALRFYLYRENAYFNPDLNGEHRLLQRLTDLGFSPETVFDIGANVGRWSAHAAELWPDADFHLFDPVPSVVAKLQERFSASPRHHIHHCAVGGDDGSVQIHENTELSSHSFVTRHSDGGAHVRLVSGETALALADVDRVDFCKIDAEGFDLEILDGLRPLLKHGRIGVIQFEHHAVAVAYGRTFSRTTQMLKDCGYRVGKLFPEGLREVRYGDHDWSYQVGPNFVAVAPELGGLFTKLCSR